MRKTIFNQDWMFTLQNELDEFNTFGFDKYSDAAGAAARFYDYSNWEKVDLPHDWALTLGRDRDANTFAGAYPNTHYHRFMTERRSNAPVKYNIGWYRKQFSWDPAWDGKRIFIEFEGIFRDAIVWVNGVYLDRHTSGYTSFALELTDHLISGMDNSIAVRVDSDHAEGWWYEGAGIYRNVHLLIGEPVYFKYHQTQVRTERNGSVWSAAVLVNDTENACAQNVVWTIRDAQGAVVAQAEKTVSVEPYSEAPVEAALQIDAPRWWDIDDPYLYTMDVQVGAECETVMFGVRTVAFDADRGFLLNGKPLKVRGACVHQDFGGVGVALSDNLNDYKIKRLKEMGVNAYRCAHHAPSPALLDACDRQGMLVMNETRTFGTSPEAQRQLTDLIERDRNHPCVFIWSLGNEEFSIQNEAWSFRLMEKMTRMAKALDPTRPVTYGGNNGSNDIGANGASEIRGVNYIRNDKDGLWLDKYHRAHPDQPIIGTEESSYVLSRGGAVNDMGNGLLDSTGGVTMLWGSTPKGWVKYMEERDYFAGSFMWTGFDYRGEPNPFYYMNVMSSFGTIDLCGMEKPPFYYYKAWWTDEPVLKLTPHWNHREGEMVTVAVFTNCEKITLLLNGRIVETRTVERFDSPLFTLPFEPGELVVEGERGGETLRDVLRTAGSTACVRVKNVLEAHSEVDVAIYELEAQDENGMFCPLAEEDVALAIENGRIIGIGNGDPSNWDDEQNPPEEQAFLVRSFCDETGVFAIPEKAPNTLPRLYDWIELEPKNETFDDDFRLVALYTYSLGEKKETTFTAKFTGAEKYEYVEFERFGGAAEVYLNGEKIGDNFRTHGRQARNTIRPYRFYCRFAQGENELKVVTWRFEDNPPAISGTVKVGRSVQKPWSVKLHYGKARVFVKSCTPEAVAIQAKIKE